MSSDKLRKFDIKLLFMKIKTDFAIDPERELHEFYQLSLYHRYFSFNLLEKLIKPLIEPVFLLIFSQENFQKTLFLEKNLEEITKEILFKYRGIFLCLQKEKNRDFLMNLSLFSTVLIVYRIVVRNFNEKKKEFTKEILFEFFRILFSTIYEMKISRSFIKKTTKSLYKDDFFEKIAHFEKDAKKEPKDAKIENFHRKAFFFESFLRKSEEISKENQFFEEFRRDLKGKFQFRQKKEISFVKNTEKFTVEKNSQKNIEFFSRKIIEFSTENHFRKNSINSSGFLKKFSLKNMNKTSASFRIFCRSSSQKKKPEEKKPTFEEKLPIFLKKSEKIRGFSAKKKKKFEKETSKKMQKIKSVFHYEGNQLKETLDFVHQQLKKTRFLEKNSENTEILCRNSRVKAWFLQEKLKNVRKDEKLSSSVSLEKSKVFCLEKQEENRKNQMKFFNEEKSCKKPPENDDFFEEMKGIMLNRKENERFFYKKKNIKGFQQLRRALYEENRSPNEKIEEIEGKILQKREKLAFFLKNPSLKHY